MTDHHLSDDFVIDLVQALDASSLERNQYRLNDMMDVVALERLVKSCEDVTVHVSVEETTLVVSKHNVRLLDAE